MSIAARWRSRICRVFEDRVSQYRPADERELIDIVASALAADEPMELVGGGSKRGLGRPLQLPHTLDLGAFAGIRQYEPEELVLTAGAATPLAEIEAALDAKSQMLAFEPGDWRALLGSRNAPTLGGILACNLAGPRRIRPLNQRQAQAHKKRVSQAYEKPAVHVRREPIEWTLQ